MTFSVCDLFECRLRENSKKQEFYLPGDTSKTLRIKASTVSDGMTTHPSSEAVNVKQNSSIFKK